jgi:hypothetical protein
MRGMVAVLVMTSSGMAVADGEKAGMLSIPERTLKVGVEGAIGNATGRGWTLLLGPAATYTHINRSLWWYGMQADVLGDFSGGTAISPRWTIGPQFGLAVLGGDLSYYGQAFDGLVFHGAAIRLKLTIGVAALYVRYGHLPEAGHHSFDFGAQLKLPIFSSDEQIEM